MTINTKSIDEIIEETKSKYRTYKNCKHEFEDQPYAFGIIGGVCGYAVKLYKCKKCSYEGAKESE